MAQRTLSSVNSLHTFSDARRTHSEHVTGTLRTPGGHAADTRRTRLVDLLPSSQTGQQEPFGVCWLRQVSAGHRIRSHDTLPWVQLQILQLS